MGDHRAILVRAGSESYPIIFTDWRRGMDELLSDAAKVAIISNGTVFALHGKAFQKTYIPRRCPVTTLMIGDGERFKTRQTVDLIYDHLFDIGLQRHDAIVAFGGGVVGDVAGFAAATYKRGVNLIHVPTTLLAMVDSSIGGKTAVNHKYGKNLIGTFYQPKGVIINPEWLMTLGQREMIEGLAEIIKAGFLSSKQLLKTAAASDWAYSSGNRDKLVSMIRAAAAFKARVVARDVYDRGSRAVLNFGHTFGHAIEKADGYGRYRHGEAVLAGMTGALFLSHLTGHLSSGRLRDYLGYLTPFIEQLKPLKRPADHYVAPMMVDKKGRNGKRIFVLLEEIGKPVVCEVRSPARVLESVELMKVFINGGGEM